jgi:hypothetical protein
MRIRERYDETVGGWQLVTHPEYKLIARFDDGDIAYIDKDDGMLVMTAVHSDRAVIPLEVLHDLQEHCS